MYKRQHGVFAALLIEIGQGVVAIYGFFGHVLGVVEHLVAFGEVGVVQVRVDQLSGCRLGRIVPRAAVESVEELLCPLRLGGCCRTGDLP